MLPARGQPLAPQKALLCNNQPDPQRPQLWSENPFHCCRHHRCGPSVLLSPPLICLFFKDPPEGTDFSACFCSVPIVSFTDDFGSGLWVTSVLSPHLPHPRGPPLTRVLCTSRLMEPGRQRMSQPGRVSSPEGWCLSFCWLSVGSEDSSWKTQ